MTKSEQLFERAVKRIPGGVNSPVRSYGAIGEAPRFIEKADKCYIYDVDGNRYVDYIDSWGPMILGHNFPEIRESVIKACENGLSFGCATEIEVEIAEFICEHIPHVDMIRMVNSGTEAVMSAIRAARGFTGKDKIIKFAGCYHGHSDCLLVSAGSGVMASGIPDSAGVPKGCTQDTMTATYNDAASVEALLKQEEGNVAAVIVEAIGANMGVVPPKPGFLKRLRQLCDEHNCLLIFDEVITGFRLAFGRVFWHSPGSCHLWKNHRRRNAGRCIWRPQRDHGSDLTVWSCIPGRYLKWKSGCHGSRIHTAEISL